MRPSRETCKFLFVSALAVAGLAPSGVPAQEQSRRKVLPLRVTSNRLDPEELDRLTAQVSEKLRKYTALEILPVPQADPMDLMVDAECVDFDAACLSTIGASHGADAVVYSEVSETEGRFQVQVRFVDVRTKETRSPEGGTEARDKVPDLLALALEKVLGPEPLPESVLARVDVETTPPGADVYVDRDFVGVSPVTLRLRKGRYVIRAARVGYDEKMQVVDVEPGKTVGLALNLAPIAVPVPSGPVPTKGREEGEPAFYETWWFWTAVGAVVIGAGTATVVLASRKTSSASGQAQFVVSPAYADRDVTLYPSFLPAR